MTINPLKGSGCLFTIIMMPTFIIVAACALAGVFWLIDAVMN